MTPLEPATQYPAPSALTAAAGMPPPAAQLVSAVVVSTSPAQLMRATTRGQPAGASFVDPTPQPKQPSVRKRPSVDLDRAPAKATKCRASA